MSLNKLLGSSALTRRTVLKGMGVIAATAAASGCSSSSSDDNAVAQSPDLNFDRSDRIVPSTGPFNCGGRCHHKFHVKNGRITSLTSAGDIQRVTLGENDPANPDENCGATGGDMQYRSCVRGYSYVKRVYQPDRLKYPLKQMGNRGDITTFQRVRWEEAYAEIALKYVTAFTRAATLGYLPIIDRIGIANNLASSTATDAINYTYISGRSNASNGNSEAAKLDAIGGNALRNSKNDALNSGFVIFWGADPTRNSNWENGSYFSATKTKEAGIPIVTISPVCTDNAVAYSSTIQVNLPAVVFTDGTRNADTVTIPGWVPIRPGTDGALLAAMMYVIYRRKLYDRQFLGDKTMPGYEDSKRKCFGFWADDSVTCVNHNSVGASMGGSPYIGYSGGIPQAGTAYKGNSYGVPANESFEEYLVRLEYGAGWDFRVNSAVAPSRLNQDRGGDNADVAMGAYNSVLLYAERITGVPALIIEALACHFANNGSRKPSRIDGGCGPQRQWGGPEFVWLQICLTAICGWTDKKGGGPAIGMGSFPDDNVFSYSDSPVTGTFVNNRPSSAATNNYITVNDQNLAEIVLSGFDGRSPTTFINDIKWTTKNENIDTQFPALATNGLEVDIYTSSNSNRLITHANINKTIQAFKKIGCVVAIDDVMTPTVAYADFVFPAASPWENYTGFSSAGNLILHTSNVLPDTMYDSRRQVRINAELGHYVAEALKIAGLIGAAQAGRYPSYVEDTAEVAIQKDQDAQEAKIATARSSNIYNNAGNTPIPAGSFTWDALKAKGSVQINPPADKPIIGLMHHTLPNPDMTSPAITSGGATPLTNSTGYINFYSPFWAERMTSPDYNHGGTYASGWRTATAKYVPVREGFEFFATTDKFSRPAYSSPASGRIYGLQFMTNKSRNRAHTAQDNVAVIKDQFVQKVYINPVDAGNRGIKDGDIVYVYNDRGCTKLPASVTHYIVPGVISVEHGSWYRANRYGETVKVYPRDINGNVPARLAGDVNPADGSITVPVDIGGAENVLTDDRFHLDVLYISQTASCHGGPVEVSLTKPE